MNAHELTRLINTVESIDFAKRVINTVESIDFAKRDSGSLDLLRIQGLTPESIEEIVDALYELQARRHAAGDSHGIEVPT